MCGDTINLDTQIQPTNLPVMVHVQRGPKQNGVIAFDITDKTGHFIKDAQLFFNNDTTKYCMPAFEGDCEVKNDIGRIKLRISGNLSSTWIPISERNIRQIQIVLEVENNLEHYAFFTNHKFVVENGHLYNLIQDSKRKNSFRRDKSYFMELEK